MTNRVNPVPYKDGSMEDLAKVLLKSTGTLESVPVGYPAFPTIIRHCEMGLAHAHDDSTPTFLMPVLVVEIFEPGGNPGIEKPENTIRLLVHPGSIPEILSVLVAYYKELGINPFDYGLTT